jgi:hypothetical protein
MALGDAAQVVVGHFVLKERPQLGGAARERIAGPALVAASGAEGRLQLRDEPLAPSSLGDCASCAEAAIFGVRLRLRVG